MTQALTPTQVAAFYPLFLCIDYDNTIIRVSERLALLLGGDLEGRQFEEVLQVMRPKLRADDRGQRLLRFGRRLFLLVARLQRFGLRGQLLAGIDDGQPCLILALTPWLTWMKEHHKDYQPDFQDYPVQDSQLDLEIYLSTQQAMMDDLKDLTQNLRAANHQVSQAMKVRTKFLSYVSHELRTPLTGIISALPLLDGQPFDAEGRTLLDVMKASSRTLLDVINQVLDFNEASEASDNVKFEPFSLSELVDEVMGIAQLGSRHKNLLLLKDIEEPLLSGVFDSDRNKIKKILLNLLSNAAKYTDAGRIKLRAGIKEESADLVTVLIQVDDDGPGVEEEYVQYLFEQYWKKLRNVDPNMPSSGLGLSITKYLADALGGKVGYRRSSIFSGSEFWVELPLAVAEVESYQSKELDTSDEFALRENSLSGEVLLVDDNSVNLLVGKLTLERTGLKVATCISGAEAIELCRDRKFSVIFMDILMPEMSGLDCSHILKTTANANSDTPIIAWSAHCSQEDMLRYHTYGIDDWIVKPPKPAVIVDLVRKWQGRSVPFE